MTRRHYFMMWIITKFYNFLFALMYKQCISKHNSNRINSPILKKLFYNAFVYKLIPRIHKINPLPRRHLYPLIHRIINPLVRFAHPVRNSVSIFPDNFNSAISAAAINNNILYVMIRLIKYGQHGLFNRVRSIVANSYY